MTGEDGEDENREEDEDQEEEEEEEEEEDSADDMRMFRDSGNGELMLAEEDMMLEHDQASGMSCLRVRCSGRVPVVSRWFRDGGLLLMLLLLLLLLLPLLL